MPPRRTAGGAGGRRNTADRPRPFLEDQEELPPPPDAEDERNFDGVSEAEEAEEEILDETAAAGDDVEDDEGEDLFNPVHLQRDYAANPELDRYDPSMLDESRGHRELSAAQARAVGELLDVRDRLESERATTTIGDAFHVQPLMEDEEADLWRRFRERREQLRAAATAGLAASAALPVQQIEEAKDELPFCTSNTGWTDRVEECLRVVFHGFLCHYKRPRAQTAQPQQQGNAAPPESSYLQAIHAMVQADRCTLGVVWDDLRKYTPKLLDWFYHLPQPTLTVLSETATEITQQRYPQLYSQRPVTARLLAYDIVESLRALTTQNLGKLICVRGVVIRRSYVEPKHSVVFYECQRCHCDSLGPYVLKPDQKRPRLICLECQGTGPFQVCREKTLYENKQTLVVQEPSGCVLPGSIPKQKQVLVLGDLVDVAKPGDEVVVTGIYETRADVRLNTSGGFPVFQTHIVANNVENRREIQEASLTETDLEIFEKLSRNPLIREKIIDSIAPSIWGHRHIKTGLAYAMLGGVQRKTAGHSIRGDINVLLLGDPGVGKSQFFKFVERAFDRTIYTTGKGSSAVGLTAAVRKDDMTGEWCLEGGALVLADEGICMIDEFDKMSEQDRVSIHEAMEQQSISISKAGIVATLNARCAVIAAANPIGGRYDSSRTFADNVDLSAPILSRFDVVAVVKDRQHPVVDELLADHIVTSHAKAGSNTGVVPGLAAAIFGGNDIESAPIDPSAQWVSDGSRLPQEVLRKYITYARRNCKPQLTGEADQAMLSNFYVELRQASLTAGGAPITVRHLESTLRMAAANARTRLSNVITRQDLHFAISTMVESFIQTQKFAMAQQLGKKFGRYRAIAASPHEFIETMLMQQLARNTQKLLQQQKLDMQQLDPTHPVVQSVVTQAEVPFAQLLCLMRSMYNIPEAAVVRYRDSQRFKQWFCLQARPGEDGKEELFIRKKAIAGQA